MAKIEYVPKKFQPETLAVIAQAERICNDYATQGYDLTLRQLYYQFVSRGLLANTQKEYNRLKGIVNDARLAGYIDWEHIVDRTRFLRDLAHWDSPTDLVKAAANQYRTDKWANQPLRVEVWIEKDALVGVLEVVCPSLDIPYFSCRGYTSQSEIWGAAQRLNQYLWKGQNVLVLHLGDHDPSGIDMSRDIEDRLRMFTGKDGTNRQIDQIVKWREEGTWPQPGNLPEKGTDEYKALVARLDQVINDWGDLEIRRIALTMDQVDEYQPPPNPAKMTDARAEGYVEAYGDESWELDALDPATLSALIREEVEAELDQEAWDEAEAAEETASGLLRGVADRWDRVVNLLQEGEEPEPE
jgi:hypothetical protein